MGQTQQSAVATLSRGALRGTRHTVKPHSVSLRRGRVPACTHQCRDQPSICPPPRGKITRSCSQQQQIPPSLLSLNTPPANTTLFNCCLLLLTAQSFAALSYSQQRRHPPPSSMSKMPPAFQLQLEQCPCLFLTLPSTEKRGTHVSRNTSEHKSATAEQRRYRAALISALLKPAAILKLFLCVSLSLPPSSLLSNILPLSLPLLPLSSPSFPSVSQGSSFSLFSSPLSLRVQ